MNLTKKTLSIKMFVCFMLIALQKPVYAADIPIFVDNVPAYSEVSPFYSNDTLLVPARLVSEELGAVVDWQNEQISINSGDCQIVLYVGQNQAQVNGTSQNLSASPQIVQGRLFVPLRFIGEALGVDVLYRDNKIFLYSINYDEKSFLCNGTMLKSSYLIYDNKTYFIDNHNSLKMTNNETNEDTLLSIFNMPNIILAVSKSGLVYTNTMSFYIQDKGTFYYNFDSQEIKKLFNTPWVSNITSSFFDHNGCLYFRDVAKSKESIYVQKPAEECCVYEAIFSVDVDGSNIKEIFVEEPNYRIIDIQSYNGWIYYCTLIPVVKDYGIDHYSGSLNRVRIDGTDKQQLTDDYIGTYYFTNEGIYYEYAYGRGSGLLKYEDLD